MNKPFVTIDLETTGLDWQRDQIILIGYRENGVGPVIQHVPLYVDGKVPRIEGLSRILKDPNIVKRGHHVTFDALFLSQAGYEINGEFDDTCILSYLENPFRSNRLKDLVESVLRKKVTRFDDFVFKPLKKEYSLWLEDNSLYFKMGNGKYADKALMLQYNADDIINCDLIRDRSSETAWYRNVEQPLIKILFDTEKRGIQLDQEHFKVLSGELGGRVEELQVICQFDGLENPASNKQVAEKLIEDGVSLEKTNKGNYKVDKLVLKKLAWKGNGFCGTLLKFRELRKLTTTYVDPLLNQSDQSGRIHGSFNQAGAETEEGETDGTKTGRLTSSGPNLQNISNRTAEGRKIRQGFIPSKGHFLYVKDLSQIEPRVLTHFCQSKKLINAYGAGLDTHSIFAADMFRKPQAEITKSERFIGKTGWLATVYGCYYKKLKVIAEINSEEEVKYDEEFFKSVQDNFWASNPEIYQWRQTHIALTRKLGYIETFGGRRIKIDGLGSRSFWERNEAERRAVNYLIQGSAADIFKIITIKLNEQLKLIDGHFLAFVHDEWLMEFPESTVVNIGKEALDTGISEIIEESVSLRNVAVKAEGGFISNWAEKK